MCVNCEFCLHNADMVSVLLPAVTVCLSDWLDSMSNNVSVRLDDVC